MACIFFQFARKKRDLFSHNKRYFELFYSLLITRLKKIIKMPLIWKFSEDAGKIVENVFKFFVEEKQFGIKMLDRAWVDQNEQSHCSENYNQEGLIAILVDRWSTGHLTLLGMRCPNPLPSL